MMDAVLTVLWKKQNTVYVDHELYNFDSKQFHVVIVMNTPFRRLGRGRSTVKG